MPDKELKSRFSHLLSLKVWMKLKLHMQPFCNFILDDYHQMELNIIARVSQPITGCHVTGHTSSKGYKSLSFCVFSHSAVDRWRGNIQEKNPRQFKNISNPVQPSNQGYRLDEINPVGPDNPT